MTIRTRLLRRPGTTALWLILTLVMSGFLTAGASLWLGTRQLAAELDGKHTAIAVRTDRAVTLTPIFEDGMIRGTTLIPDNRQLEQAELDWLEGQPSVKAVRIHSLSGGSAEGFESYLGLRREFGFRSSGNTDNYRRCLVVGTVIAKDAYGGPLIGVEQVLCMHSEYLQTMTTPDPEDIDRDWPYYLGLAYVSIYNSFQEIPAVDSDFFEVGQRYILSGDLLDGRASYYRPLTRSRMQTIFTAMVDLGSGVEDADGLWTVHADLGDGSSQDFADYDYPCAQKIDGSLEEFLSAHPVWEAYRQSLDRHLHSLPVLGTDRLESLYMFVKGEAAVVEGRSFTDAEYASGSRVMVISDMVAAKHGLAVGDRIKMTQFLCAVDSAGQNVSVELLSPTGQLKWPGIGMVRPGMETGPEGEFEIVGIYRLSDYWSLGSYAFTPDTVFIPKKAQIDGAWGPESEDLYGVYLSVELNNGMLDDFKLALANSPYAGRYYTVDQGFEQVQRNLNDLRLNARRLALTALAAWSIFVLLYLMMYQAGQRRNLGILRSQGSGIPAARRYLFFGGLIVAALGVVIGTLLSTVVLNRVEQTILSDMLAQIDRTATQELVISEETLTSLVKASGLQFRQLLLLGTAQLGVLAVILWAHAAILARKNPRQLMEV